MIRFASSAALAFACAAVAASAGSWTPASGETDARYTLEWTRESVADSESHHLLRLRLSARSGWHVANAAPITLRLEPAAAGVGIDPAVQRREDAKAYGEDGFEFEAVLSGSASGQLKFGLCQGENERCFIIRRLFDVD